MRIPKISEGVIRLATTVIASLLPNLGFGAGYDTVLRGGMIYDGSGGPPYSADIAIDNDKIAFIGTVSKDDLDATARVMDISGLAVSSGFINVLSWANESLLIDGRSLSDIRQGVTLEVFGEGSSMGPITPAMRTRMTQQNTDLNYDIPWTTLGEYLDHLVAQGVSPNVASFVGATTVRIHELGYDNRQPNPEQLSRMQALVEQAMLEGALGVGSSLIYAPAFYAQTGELIALMNSAARHGGSYISHLRSEGNRLLESLEELIYIAEQTRAPAQIYHLKIAGQSNWHKMDAVIKKIEAARARGLMISANMYSYTAGSTGLDASMPPWVQEGGYSAWRDRLRNPDIRQQILQEMITPTDAWENLLLAAGPDNTLLVGFNNPKLRAYTGKTLTEVARLRGQTPQEAAIDLVVEDGSQVQVIYFLMSEDNVARTMALPWVSYGSDAASLASEGIFLNRSTHPRAYGNFARVLGEYVREQKVLTLPKAIQKLTQLPARQLGLRLRGTLAVGFFADLTVFDPMLVRDNATYTDPHQYATGVIHVFVNGQPVLLHTKHTGRLPGRVVRGPGWAGWADKNH